MVHRALKAAVGQRSQDKVVGCVCVCLCVCVFVCVHVCVCMRVCVHACVCSKREVERGREGGGSMYLCVCVRVFVCVCVCGGESVRSCVKEDMYLSVRGRLKCVCLCVRIHT